MSGFIVFALISVSTIFAPLTTQAAVLGKVVKVHGEAKVNNRQATPDLTLWVGDSVSTGNGAFIVLNLDRAGSELRVEANTDLEIKKFEAGQPLEVKMEKGKIRARVLKTAAAGILVTSPTAAALARETGGLGCDFTLSYDASSDAARDPMRPVSTKARTGASEVLVFAGKVELTALQDKPNPAAGMVTQLSPSTKQEVMEVGAGLSAAVGGKWGPKPVAANKVEASEVKRIELETAF